MLFIYEIFKWTFKNQALQVYVSPQTVLIVGVCFYDLFLIRAAGCSTFTQRSLGPKHKYVSVLSGRADQVAEGNLDPPVR